MARYVRQSSPYALQTGCRYCGTMACTDRDADGRLACRAVECQACGLRTCSGYGLGSGSCPACYVGLLAGWSGSTGPCDRARCENPRVAVERRRYVCRQHLKADVHNAREIATTGDRGILRLFYIADEQEREAVV